MKVNFETTAIELFAFQYHENAFYKMYCDGLKKNPDTIKTIFDIPFLPITFLKNHTIKTTLFQEETVFLSSATTSNTPSRHAIKSVSDYLLNTIECFEKQYGNIRDYAFLFLLPSYLERQDSSLVAMAQHFVKQTNHKSESGFFLHNFDALQQQLSHHIHYKTPTILCGVTFALLDFATAYPMPLHDVIVMETGGMKGRRKEMLRSDVHDFLCKQFSLSHIHSEYGMTELMSQAYSTGSGIFVTHQEKMRVFVRDVDNPLSCFQYGKGAINIIDLENKFSCAFIATEDRGEVFADNSFSILGRIDYSQLRGCNQMIE